MSSNFMILNMLIEKLKFKNYQKKEEIYLLKIDLKKQYKQTKKKENTKFT